MLVTIDFKDAGLWEKKFPLEPVPYDVFIEENYTNNGDICAEITERFKGRPWNRVVLNDWLCTASIGVMRYYISPSAFKYYLPSLLCGVACDGRNYLDWALDALLPNNSKKIAKGEWWFSFLQKFTSGQRLWINKYLHYMDSMTVGEESREKDLIGLALNKFWIDG